MIDQKLTSKLDFLFEASTNFSDFEGLPVAFSKNNPATQNEIASAFSDGKMKVPNDCLHFLQHYNGCTLFQFQDLGGFELLGTETILAETLDRQDTYRDNWENNLTVFCRLICDGDFISFKTYSADAYEILDCYHDGHPQDWKVISNSFQDFIEILIDEKGRRFWL